MKIRLLCFSLLRDLTGFAETVYETDPGVERVRDLLEELEGRWEGLADWRDRLLVAVNQEYADGDTELSEGDEVALMPPVQGG